MLVFPPWKLIREFWLRASRDPLHPETRSKSRNAPFDHPVLAPTTHLLAAKRAGL